MKIQEKFKIRLLEIVAIIILGGFQTVERPGRFLLSFNQRWAKFYCLIMEKENENLFTKIYNIRYFKANRSLRILKSYQTNYDSKIVLN